MVPGENISTDNDFIRKDPEDGLMDYFIMEWIDINEKVIVCFGGNDLGSVAIKYLPSPVEGHHIGWYPGGQNLYNATHWMPLPPSPDKKPVKK